MAKRKTRSRKKKKNNSILIFFVVVIVIAILAFAITYLVSQSEKDEFINQVQVTEKTVEPATDPSELPPGQQKVILDGTWASYNDGAMLTITGLNYTIELPNVESTMIGRGRVVVANNKITFVNTDQDSQCSIKPGVYGFILDGDEVTFEPINDDCKERTGRIEATWFRV